MRREFPGRCAHREQAMGGHREKMAIRKPRRGAAEAKPAGICILDFPASRTMSKYVSVVEATQPVVFRYGGRLTQCAWERAVPGS